MDLKLNGNYIEARNGDTIVQVGFLYSPGDIGHGAYHGRIADIRAGHWSEWERIEQDMLEYIDRASGRNEVKYAEIYMDIIR